MDALMSRAARLAVRRPQPVIAGWVVLVIVFGSWGAGLFGNTAVQDKLLPTQILVNGTDSNRAEQLAKGHFGEKLALLLTGPADEIEKQGRPLARALAKRPNTSALSPWSNAKGTEKLRPSPEQAVITLDVRLAGGETVSTFIPPLKRFVEQQVTDPVQAHLSGLDVIGRAQNEQLVESISQAEKLALPVLVIVLLLVFRAPLAAAVPLLMGLATARAGFGILNIVADYMRLDAIALGMASMIGLALGVDYSLLIVSRFREALASGRSVGHAASLAANTAGRTAAFAGFVLLAMMLVVIVLSPGTIMRSSAIGAMVVTILSMVAAVLVTPGIMRLAGHRINAFSIGGVPAVAAGRPGMIEVIVRRVTGRPLLAVLSVASFALLIASPALALPGNMIPPDPRQLPPDDPVLNDYLAIRKAGFGPEVDIILRAPDGTLLDPNRVTQIRNLQRRLKLIPDAKFVVGPNQIAQQTAGVRQLPKQLEGVEKQVTEGKTKLAKLERGLGRATDGVSQLRSGLGRAASGAQQLDNGALRARNGAQQIAAGNRQVRQGFGRLEDGLRQALDGAKRLARGTTRAQQGSTRIADGTNQLYHGLADQLAPGAELLAAGLRDGRSGLEELRLPAQITERETRTAWDLLNAMTVGKTDPLFQPTLQAVGTALGAISGRDPVTGQNVFPQSMDASLESLAGKAGQAADGATRIAAAARQAANGAHRLHGGSIQLRDGLERLENGLFRLRDGIRQMHVAVEAAGPNVRRLEIGSGQLAHGLKPIQGGTRQLAAGLSDGVARSEPLETGLGNAYTGVADFRRKLTGPGGSFNLLDRFNAVQKRSPKLFDSGFLPIAAVSGSRPADRQPSQLLLDARHGGDVGSIQVLPNVPANDPRTDRLVSRIRDVVGEFHTKSGLETATGGAAAQLVDFKSITTTRLPLLVIGICLVTYLMLVLIMRSLLLSAIAVVLNLITVGMGFGILVLLFAVGDEPLLGGAGSLDVIAVAGIFSITFALAIDYQVFLLTRMREEFVRTQSNDAAIEFGISKTAAVVTGAALIMIAVFSAFALAKFVTIKMFGIGLATSVLIDATLVRLVLLPAVMRLFGLNTWWIPTWLDERLPLIDVTGAEFEHEQEQMTPYPART
jgi:RND superfamily putative drug exporter